MRDLAKTLRENLCVFSAWILASFASRLVGLIVHACVDLAETESFVLLRCCASKGIAAFFISPAAPRYLWLVWSRGDGDRMRIVGRLLRVDTRHEGPVGCFARGKNCCRIFPPCFACDSSPTATTCAGEASSVIRLLWRRPRHPCFVRQDVFTTSVRSPRSAPRHGDDISRCETGGRPI